MRSVAESVLPAGSVVTAVTAERGPSSIESEADSAIAAAEVVSLLRSTETHDAYLVACFGDPGLEAARELTDAPVVGIGEAAYAAAGLIAKRFAVAYEFRRSTLFAINELPHFVALNIVNVQAANRPLQGLAPCRHTPPCSVGCR